MRIRLFAPESSAHTPYWLSLLRTPGTELELFSLSSESGPVDRRRLAPLAFTAWRSGASDVSVIHTLGTHGLLGALAPRARRVVLVPWGSEVNAARSSSVRRRIAKFIIERADLIVTTSTGTKDTLAQLYGETPAIHVVSWGVDVAAIQALDREQARAHVRECLGVEPEVMLVVSPRGLTPTYQAHKIEAAAARAAAMRRDVHLVTIDSGAAQGVLDDAVRLQRWHTRLPQLAKRDLHRLLRASDVVVSTPVTDQRSTTVLEALAAGTQVILNDLPSYREIAADGATCLILDDSSVPALAEALVASRACWRQDNEEWARRTEDAQHQAQLLKELCIGGVTCA